MSVEILPRPVVPDRGDGDGEIDHLYCCVPERALCGADLSAAEDCGAAPAPKETLCPMCEVLNDAGGPCGVPGCRERVRWRWLFGFGGGR